MHVPFCRQKCLYCSFISSTNLSQEANFVDRLLGDIADWGHFFNRPALETVYLGGGTPSVISLASLQTITEAVFCAFDTSNLMEATLEANPGTVSKEWLKVARQGGWNRISIGVQTLDISLLKRLGRIHTTLEALDSIKMCKDAGFDHINADLMLGIPGQCLEQVLDDAGRLIEVGIDHLSVYMVDLDKACPMKSLVDCGVLFMPEDDLVADIYIALNKYLTKCGFGHYEISNYSRPECHSIHNMRYWQRYPYIGLGPSAASNIGSLRWSETEHITKWIDGVADCEIVEMTPRELLAEIPLLALRTHVGVNWKQLCKHAETENLLGIVKEWEKSIVPFVNNGLLIWENDSLRLTLKGMLLSNQVLQIFVE
ncbi:MAG: radical SAM family heme chaperone HemW [Holophagaceae bacterium]|nr:radical SAM family heme chaperone HemW [Holophagaceae bacterium]